VEPSPLLLLMLIGLLYQPRMIDGDDCGAVSGVNEGPGESLLQCLCVHHGAYMT
jgi:hypothetical protein